MSRCLALAAAIAFLIHARCEPSCAAPIVIGLPAFSGSETVIDFEAIVQSEVITTQFTGVTFSGLFGETTGLGFFTNSTPGNVVADNENSLSGPLGPFFDPIADFAQPVTRVGFFAVTNPSDDIRVTAFRDSGAGLIETGSFVYTTSVPDVFIGIEDGSGIDRIVIDAFGPVNGALILNDFRFEGSAVSAVPEPLSVTIWVTGGLLGVALGAYRTRRKPLIA